MTAFTLADLEAIIRERTQRDATTSYTKSLLDKGAPRVAKKFGEEAVELVIAAVERQEPEIVGESADVLYHLMVLLQACGIPLSSVLAELERRTRQSGHDEKAGRPK